MCIRDSACCDVEQILHVHSAAQEPGKHGAGAATQPETAGEICPACAGEEIGRWIADRGIRGGDVGLLAGLVVEQEQQGEDVNGSDRRQHTGCLLILRVAQWAADGERAVEQVTEGGTGLKTTEVGGDARAVEGQIVDQPLDEVTCLLYTSDAADE